MTDIRVKINMKLDWVQKTGYVLHTATSFDEFNGERLPDVLVIYSNI